MFPTETYPKFMLVLDHIRQGRLPTRACAQAGVSWSMLKKALREDPNLSDMFEEALLECRDQMLEALVSINDPGPGQVYSETDAKMATVISNNIKWVLEKMWPEKFMTKLSVTHNSTADAAIISALEAAIQRIPLPAPAPPPQLAHQDVIDVPFVLVPRQMTIEEELASVV